MNKVGSIEIDVTAVKMNDLALIDGSDNVWIVVPPRWWDLATWLFWLLLPADRRAHVRLNLGSGEFLSCRAVRMAKRYVRLRGRVIGAS